MLSKIGVESDSGKGRPTDRKLRPSVGRSSG